MCDMKGADIERMRAVKHPRRHVIFFATCFEYVRYTTNIGVG